MNHISERFRRFYESGSAMPQKKSENAIVEDLIGNTPYIVREYVRNLPSHCFEVMSVNQHLNQDIVDFGIKSTSQILLPSQINSGNRRNVRYLSSTGESGRAMEFPTDSIQKQLKNSGLGQCLNLKGVGATKFKREYGFKNIYANINDSYNPEFDLTEQENQMLSKISFHKEIGVLSLKEAIKEYNLSIKLLEEGVENIQVPVSVVSLNSIYNQSGELQKIDSFDDYELYSKAGLGILARLTQTNFRFSDIDVLTHLGYFDSVSKIINFSYSKYLEMHSLEEVDLKPEQFILSLVERVAKNEIRRSMLGYVLYSTHWQDISRNISLLGDRFDCQGMSHFHRHSYQEIECEIKYIFEALGPYFRIFRQHLPDLKLSDYLLCIIKSIINEYFESIKHIGTKDPSKALLYSDESTIFCVFSGILNRLIFIESDFFDEAEQLHFQAQLVDLMKNRLKIDEYFINEYLTSRLQSISISGILNPYLHY